MRWPWASGCQVTAHGRRLPCPHHPLGPQPEGPLPCRSPAQQRWTLTCGEVPPGASVCLFQVVRAEPVWLRLLTPICSTCPASFRHARKARPAVKHPDHPSPDPHSHLDTDEYALRGQTPGEAHALQEAEGVSPLWLSPIWHSMASRRTTASHGSAGESGHHSVRPKRDRKDAHGACPCS